MKHGDTAPAPSPPDRDWHAARGPFERALAALSRFAAPMFSFFFMVFALLFAVYAGVEFARPVLATGNVIEGLVKGLHTGVVALAVYELAQIVREEHDQQAAGSVMMRIRRGVARFGNVVFVALVLEALIMVIKYSQQDLAGFLYYPAVLVLSASALLVSLGLFIRLAAPPARNAFADGSFRSAAPNSHHAFVDGPPRADGRQTKAYGGISGTDRAGRNGAGSRA